MVISESLRQKLKRWGDYAREHGLTEQLIRDYRLLHQSLVKSPDAGEPAYRLHHMDVLVYRISFDLLVIYYAVDETRHVVYVKDILATSAFAAPEAD